MKIGILGSGDVAKALARGFLARGDDVMLGTRNPAKLEDWLRSAGPKARAGSFAQAAAFGEAIALGTLGTATVGVLEEIGPAPFAGKVVIDATNPLDFDESGAHLAFGFSDSLGERVQRTIPGAKVVKAFNTVGNQFFVKPSFAGGPPTMMIAGNDADAKKTVAGMLKDFGWESADFGGIESARYLEPMCMAWIAVGAAAHNYHHAFKLLS